MLHRTFWLAQTVLLATVVTASTLATAATPKGAPDFYQRAAIGADRLFAQGIDGTGVVIAVLDTGLIGNGTPALMRDLKTTQRVLAQYDAIHGVLVDASHRYVNSVGDGFGHGTHIASLIVSSNRYNPALRGQPQGIAPMAKLISVKAFDGNGAGRYEDVVKGLDWILANRNTYGAIRVVNLSFGAPPQSAYWNDPIDQAVMRLWQAGIVVVASAGNFGPQPQTISVPGNTPYVITVGAMTDHYDLAQPQGWGVATFSSVGPTYEGFVKPDILAPGGHLAGIMQGASYSQGAFKVHADTHYGQTLAQNHPQFATGYFDLSNDTYDMFVMSGTSQAAAVTTGVVALMLQAHPEATPDQVKCRLVASSHPLENADVSYTPFQQGAGFIDAYAAVNSTATGCANQGLNLASDLAGAAHYGGPAHQDAKTGAFYVTGEASTRLTDDARRGGTTVASAAGYMWNNGYLWNNGYMWNNGYLWNQSTVAPESSPVAVESWNEQE